MIDLKDSLKRIREERVAIVSELERQLEGFAATIRELEQEGEVQMLMPIRARLFELLGKNSNYLPKGRASKEYKYIDVRSEGKVRVRVRSKALSEELGIDPGKDIDLGNYRSIPTAVSIRNRVLDHLASIGIESAGGIPRDPVKVSPEEEPTPQDIEQANKYLVAIMLKLKRKLEPMPASAG